MKAKVILLICLGFGIIKDAQAQRYDDSRGDHRNHYEHRDGRYGNDRQYRDHSDKRRGEKYNDNKYKDRRNPNRDHDNRNESRDHDHDRRGDRKADQMGESDFSNALYTIKNAGFSSTQLTMAQNIVNSNWLSTDQVIRIMNLFSFEDTKLRFAKYAYPKCVDPGNYFNVANAFSFSSSKEALSNFISQQ